jgi:gliding motility-associated lipoprotein GldH
MSGIPVKTFFVTILFAVMLSSCNQSIVYDEQVTIQDAKWYKGESARFSVEINDSLTAYNFYLTIRNTTDYRYSNLYVFLLTRFPNGNLSRDTIECMLADKTGMWLGKGWGSIKENTILLKQNLRFPLSGDYQFLIQQAMRVDTLEDITNVGLRIEKDNY